MANRDAQLLSTRLTHLHEHEDLNEMEIQAIRHAMDFLRGRGELTKQEFTKLHQILEQIDTNLLKRYKIR